MTGSNVGRAWRYGLLGVLIIIGIAVGGWKLNWWVAQQSVNKNAQIQSSSYGAQTGIQSAITNDVDQVDTIVVGIPTSVTPNQDWTAALAAANAACRQAERLNPAAMPVPPDMQAWVNTNCSMGYVSMTSPIRLKQGNGGT